MSRDNPFETEDYQEGFVDLLGISKPSPSFGAKSEPAKTDLADVMPIPLSHRNGSTSNVPVNIAIPMPLKTVVDCKTAWKNVQGIGENSVENCPPRYVS